MTHKNKEEMNEQKYQEQPPYQQQGQYQGQPPYQQQGQYQGQPPYQQQGQYQGQPSYQQQEQYQGQPSYQQQEQYQGQPSYQQPLRYQEPPQTDALMQSVQSNQQGLTQQLVQQQEEIRSDGNDTRVLQGGRAMNYAVKKVYNPEEQAYIEKIKQGIQLGNYETVSRYGIDVQKSLSSHSKTLLDKTRGKDTGEVGKLLETLMYDIKSVELDKLTEEGNLFQKLMGRVKKKKMEIMQQYQTVGQNIDNISHELAQHSVGLEQDNVELQNIYESQLAYLDSIELYIEAGKERLEDIRQQVLPKMIKQMETNKDERLAQEVQDVTEFAKRLEKRIYDLNTTKAVTLQSIPQVRMIRESNLTLRDKINDSINTVIPLWQQQLTIAITLDNQKVALQAQKSVSDTTNQLLLKNAEMLKINTIETARENERGVVDIETLRAVQQNSIDTIREVMAIQEEGSKKRLEATKEMEELERQQSEQLREIAITVSNRAIEEGKGQSVSTPTMNYTNNKNKYY